MSNTPRTLHMVGNAHLDPAWMWQWGEGMEAFLATCRSALDRMEETEQFIFTCSSAAHYQWVEQVEPELFARIAERVRQGRWNVVGGWWVQADCNLPSGEGFARQALLGQRYFHERFGITATTGYSPDAFGHNIGLPQLLARAGMRGYIFCRPDPTELPLPSPLVRWIGPDGSSVLAYRVPYHYNMYESSVPKKLAGIAAAYGAASELAAEGRPLGALAPEWMLFYGVGNHGGGPTRQHIEEIIAANVGISGPEVLFSTPDRYFAQAGTGQWEIPDWREDLQLNAPGCYSAHSAIKKLNRASESLLAEAERFSVLAGARANAPYPAADLERAWQAVCFNHFHDILCGVAIREALDDAIESYGLALTAAKQATRFAVQRLARTMDTTGPGLTLAVFNSHSFAVHEPVTFELWHDIDKALWQQPVHVRVTDDDGADLPCQIGFTSGKIGRDRIAITFTASVPALGWRCYRVHYGEQSALPEHTAIGLADTVLQNEHIRCEIDPDSGAIARLLHIPSGTELLAGPGGHAVVIEDRTDTWGHGVARFDNVIGTFGNARVRLVENGPTHATIRAESTYGPCRLQQDVRLYRDCDTVHVAVRLFWTGEHRMVKLSFAVPAPNATMYVENAYAVTRRPPDGIERPGGAWACILSGSEDIPHPVGLGITNNAKYGYSATVEPEDRAAGRNASTILSVSVLRSPGYAIHDPHPHNADEDMEYLDQGSQRFSYQLHPIVEARWRTRLARAAELLNAPLVPHLESAHTACDAAGTRTYQGIELDAHNVLATVVKQAANGQGTIVRLYETEGRDTGFVLRMLGAEHRLFVHASEVLTVLLHGDTIVRTDLAEFPLPPGS